jgi:hypothetical protein
MLVSCYDTDLETLLRRLIREETGQILTMG